jgi:hypothetical protein
MARRDNVALCHSVDPRDAVQRLTALDNDEESCAARSI